MEQVKTYDFSKTGYYSLYNFSTKEIYNLDSIHYIIDQINKKDYYDYLALNLRPYGDQSQIQDFEIPNLIYLLDHISPVHGLSLNGGLNSYQATEVIKHLDKINVTALFIESGNLTDDGISEFTQALASTQITLLSLQDQTNDSVLISLDLSDTNVTRLSLDRCVITGMGLAGLIDNLEGTKVKELTFSDTVFSPEAMEMADFSNLDLTKIYFLGPNFSNYEIATLQFNSDSLLALTLTNQDFSAESLKLLSEKLMNTKVETLQLYGGFFEEDALAGLQLSQTQVKTLDLSESNIDISMFALLNLKQANVEEIILFDTEITDESIDMLKSLIQDSSVQNIALGGVVYKNGQFVEIETIVHNDTPKLTHDDEFSLIQPKSSKQVIAFTDVITQNNKKIFDESTPISTDSNKGETSVLVVNIEPIGPHIVELEV